MADADEFAEGRARTIRLIAEDVCDSLGTLEPQTVPVADEMFQCLRIFDQRQRLYGCGNIAAHGDFGILIRLHDKMARLDNLYKLGESDTEESIADAWRDICNYAAMALTCRRGQWEGFTS